MDKDGAGAELAALMELIARLRAPDGCPWDREQNLASVVPYLLEETYEAVDAVENGDAPEACGELGDVLFQIVFLVSLYQEAGHFNLTQVLKQVREKMTRRHPHVFGEDKVERAEQVVDLWGTIKKRERKAGDKGALEGLPLAAPALVRAMRLGKRAARVGLDWQEPEGVWAKIQEEMRELAEASGQKRQEEELGDVLFAWAQWARHQGLNPESALRRANARFQGRFEAMERAAGRKGVELDSLNDRELDDLWEEAKAREQNRTAGKV